MSSHLKIPQYLAAISACMGAMCAGTALAWTSNITGKLRKGALNGLEMNDEQLSWTGSSMTIGCMIMCFPIGIVCDKIGRKTTCILTAIPFLVGWLMIIFANHTMVLYGGRFLIGVAAGSVCVSAPIYTSEVSHAEVRGTLGIFFQLFMIIGILHANIFGFVLELRYFNMSCAVFPLKFAFIFIFQPESPVYHMAKNNYEKAEKALQQLRGDNYDCDAELKQIRATIEEEQMYPSFRQAMKTKAAKKATLICFMLMFYQQFCGISSMLFYAQELFTAAGCQYEPVEPPLCVIIFGCIQLIATIFCAVAIERVGRKILLMTSCGLMALASMIIGAFFILKHRNILNEGALKYFECVLPLVGTTIFIVAFSMGLGPIPWMAPAEIFPPEVKSICTATAATFNWLLVFLVSKFYLNLADSIGHDSTFFIFAAISISGVIFTRFVVPETKGKTFAEIVKDLTGKKEEEYSEITDNSII
ncbi:unnamed protein product [Acanthoscelides obtectus]|uniref:Major facilitator superfamily (MFS) profile domain-containing protein n=1 Tax=Acanthoscelides obtectus TaxID=200917 RepID=A0A9P0PLX0_ACAOB|nr:unnamed protein product [Acanthoscelides obtectus]CAK1650791.1 Facilitated trehalose transporter Tret1 [Acanthoscelides obtectus]